MKLQIHSRRAAESQGIHKECQEPYVWISIRDVGSQPAKLPPNSQRKGQLFLEFDDVEYTGIWFQQQNRYLAPLGKNQALAILDFVDKHKGQVDLICVNCEAGISRSAGVAEAVSLILNQHDSGIRTNPRYHPNTHVKSTIMAMTRERSELTPEPARATKSVRRRQP